jgi:hypothetical protein
MLTQKTTRNGVVYQSAWYSVALIAISRKITKQSVSLCTSSQCYYAVMITKTAEKNLGRSCRSSIFHFLDSIVFVAHVG